MKHQRMLPFNESDRDPVRHELDRQFLTDVLGITSDDVHAAVGRLREKLCAEPSIHGGKKSRCDLEAEARTSKTPAEVGNIYLELSKSSRFSTSLPAEDKVIKTIRILYDTGHQETADEICIQFAKVGFGFLKSLYNEYHR